MGELTILGVSDSSYLPFIRILFNSIKCNVKIPYKFHLHTINVPEKKINFFKDTYENIEFTGDKIELDETSNSSNSFNKSKKAAYCANIRAKVLHYLMTRGDEYILYLDADSIVRKDLEELFLLIKDTDLIIFRRDEQQDSRTKVLTSVIGINNNVRSLRFIENWKRFMIQDRIIYSWFSDQTYFYKSMLKHPDVKVSPLPALYVDSGFENKSFIWNGKGNRKYKSREYTKEMQSYE